MARDDRDIKRMRERFVCVRITRLNGINLRRFQFDYDTTWNAFFLDEKLNVYSRYGGRDDGEPEDRLSKASLLRTMSAVLEAHSLSRKRRAMDRRTLFQPIDKGTQRPRDIPLLKQSHQGCVHCHQVREYQFLQAAKDGKFSRRQIFEWPLPENIGIKIDRKHGFRVENTLKDSAADKAGLKTGDVLLRTNDVPIRSEYDLRWALGRVKEKAAIRMLVRRKLKGVAKTIDIKLQPKPGWRETNIGWRKSMRSLPLPFGFRGYRMTGSQRKEQGLTESNLAIRVVALEKNSLAESLKLHRKDTILSVGNIKTDRTLERLKSDLIRGYRAGDTVRMTVLRNGKRLQLSGTFPKWGTDETSVP